MSLLKIIPIVSCFKRRTTNAVNYLNQCSPYQTVTGTIRNVQSDPIKEMNEYMKKCLSIHKLFFLWATHFGKKTVTTE